MRRLYVTSRIAGFLAKESEISFCAVRLVKYAALTLSQAPEGALLVFRLLFIPCAAAIASIKRELGTAWVVVAMELCIRVIGRVRECLLLHHDLSGCRGRNRNHGILNLTCFAPVRGMLHGTLQYAQFTLFFVIPIKNIIFIFRGFFNINEQVHS